MNDTFVCNVCDPEGRPAADVEIAVVRPNLRRLQGERFAVWRCPTCSSIHAKDSVDLDRYYRDYPFLTGELDGPIRIMYRSMLKRLKRAGVNRSHRILDYGCGSGRLVRFLREAGYEHAIGYDAYSKEFDDPAILAERYDCIVSQDVIEHVAEPWVLLKTFAGLSRSGGLIAIGTPEASAIDLSRSDDFIHPLHAPFHRHILSKKALLDAGQRLGWKLSRYYSTSYSNTLVPFINTRFIFHYAACLDNMMDVAFEPLRFSNYKLWTLHTLFYGFFGYFLAPKTDVMAVFVSP
jgi:SAM-dependent methyltransferase